MTTSTQVARTTLRLALVAGAAVSVIAATGQPAHAAPTAPAVAAATTTGARTERLAGADRYGTAVAISRHQFPAGAKSVYLVSATAYADAIAAGMVADGPILLVPTTGVPAAVKAEIRRLAPSTVYAIGGVSVVPQKVLVEAAQGRAAKRLAGADRYATAVAVSRHAKPTPPRGDASTLVVNSTPLADGVAAGAVASPNLPVLPVPAQGAAPAVVRQEIARLAGGNVAAVGGRAVVSDATLKSAAGGMHTSRLDGANRYDTSVAVAAYRWSGVGSDTVYLASGEVFADALAAGSLGRGPVVLVPKSGVIPQSVAQYIDGLNPKRVVALGGPGAVSDPMLTMAKAAADGHVPTIDVRLPNPYSAKDRLRPGWTVVEAASKNEPVSCTGGSPAGLVPNTYSCSPSASYAVACYAKPGYANTVTCIADPWAKQLLEYRTTAALPKTPATPLATARPIGVAMQSGLSCTLRYGGAWGSRPAEDVIPWAGCENGHFLWESPMGTGGTRTAGATTQYRLGEGDQRRPLVWDDAEVRFYLG